LYSGSRAQVVGLNRTRLSSWLKFVPLNLVQRRVPGAFQVRRVVRPVAVSWLRGMPAFWLESLGASDARPDDDERDGRVRFEETLPDIVSTPFLTAENAVETEVVSCAV